VKSRRLLHFITQSLKPYIDGHYRTKKEKESTGIAGSSLGGLFAYYAWLNKPEVFGNAGIFSPSFWIGTAELEQQTDKLAYLQNPCYLSLFCTKNSETHN
jgi:predicted alpha/beta superfamily hydrolase